MNILGYFIKGVTAYFALYANAFRASNALPSSNSQSTGLNSAMPYAYNSKQTGIDGNNHQHLSSGILPHADNSNQISPEGNSYKHRDHKHRNHKHRHHKHKAKRSRVIRHLDNDPHHRRQHQHIMLLSAVEEDRLDKVHFFVKRCDVNPNAKYLQKDGSKETALTYAVRKNKIRTAIWLIMYGNADINAKDNNGVTVLMWAVRISNQRMVKLLLEHDGIDVNTKDNNGINALMHARRIGNQEIIKLLLAHPSIDVNVQDKDGVTATQYIADTSLSFTNNGTNINTTSSNVDNVESSTQEITKLLQDKDTAELPSNSSSESPGSLLSPSRDTDVSLDDKSRSSCGDTAGTLMTDVLLDAVKQGRLNVVKFLVEQCDVNANVMDDHQVTALMHAFIKNDVPMAQWLIMYGNVDVNAQSPSGMTALMYAANPNYSEMSNILVGRSDLIFGAKVNYLAAVKLLLKFVGTPSDINAQDVYKMSALLYATSVGNLEMVSLLVEYDIDINAHNIIGMTALMYAAQANKLEIAKLLLKYHGINVNAHNNNGMTALMYAVLASHKEMVKLLLEQHSINVNTENNDGMTALDLSLSLNNGTNINTASSDVDNTDPYIQKITKLLQDKDTAELPSNSSSESPGNLLSSSQDTDVSPDDKGLLGFGYNTDILMKDRLYLEVECAFPTAKNRMLC